MSEENRGLRNEKIIVNLMVKIGKEHMMKKISSNNRRKVGSLVGKFSEMQKRRGGGEHGRERGSVDRYMVDYTCIDKRRNERVTERVR